MADPAQPPPDAPRPRRKPGPPKGTRPAGRKKGVKNKATIAREIEAAKERERVLIAEAQRQGAMSAEIEKTTGAPPAVSGKDVLIQLVSVYMGLTARYQPWAQWTVVDGVRTNANPNYDEAMFRHYSAMAKETAAVLTPFQYPRYSAMVVGASVVTKVEIVGGMTDDFRGPVAPGQTLDLKPLTIITADEDVIEVPIPKAVGQ